MFISYRSIRAKTQLTKAMRRRMERLNARMKQPLRSECPDWLLPSLPGSKGCSKVK